jgi:hypothetical protein
LLNHIGTVPVDVLLDIAGHVKVDDMLHIGDIQATGSHSGGNCKKIKNLKTIT